MHRISPSLLFLLLAWGPAHGQGPGGAPIARSVPKVDTLHGEVRVDEYFWLRERSNPEVIAHLEAENRYAEATMAPTEGLRKRLYAEMRGRMPAADQSPPTRIGPYLYYRRMEPGKQYAIHARKRGSVEEVYLDLNELAQGHRHYRADLVMVSPDHGVLAFTEDTTGSERYSLRFRELATGRFLPERIDSVSGSAAWAADGRTIFYTRADRSQRPDRILRHTIGTDPASDVVVFREADPLFRVQVYRTRDNRYVIVRSLSVNTAEAHFVAAERPNQPLRMIAPRHTGGRYHVEHNGGRFIFYTNTDSASNFKISAAPVANPGRDNWRDLVPHRSSVLISDYEVFRNHLVMYERRDALRPIRIRDLRTGAEHTLSFADSVYSAFRGSNPDHDTDTLRFTYSSFVTPTTIYAYQMDTRRRTVVKRDSVAGHDPSRYATERTWARAPDGALVPVSLVYRRPLARDGTRPLLLYAYGAYSFSTDAQFDSRLFSLLDRGVVCAIAHVRGGQEMGRQWYEQGKMLEKRNTFTDFIASAEHLVREGYTSASRLAIRGGSAGGTLVGAVINMRPELFRTAVAEAPFVDPINTLLDASLPLTTSEWEYWGNPRVREQYEYLRTYSPYDNVARQRYPSLLATAGLNDPRVAYWEPAKWVARLRAHDTARQPLLLRTSMGAGHRGASGRFDALEEEAFVYAFILSQLEVREN
jgi:oligopeptidase B